MFLRLIWEQMHRILVDPSVEMQQEGGEYSLQLKCCLMNMERVSLGNDLLCRDLVMSDPGLLNLSVNKGKRENHGVVLTVLIPILFCLKTVIFLFQQPSKVLSIDSKAKFIIDAANHRIDPEADEVSMRGQKAVSRSKITCAVKQLN
ncbi:uncharacterized protein [Coffea arabica]|uniref:Uncharacterized protein isoform X1 n=1 Tax=Coffea arabica TaxID=13443 RepID=A0ABM4US03_COFAR